ncbi:tRNA (adenosine(37)-N6)-threonylcarbamoyltransferase complex dimerization subunit type 1 TsaB [Candidatus Phytoplasma prunorum]|uniref:tRNA (adenosine(37)-N6)-threonylcarbamoyltransferase complex dimerization subunit type 1 TsaB n=1 Tax=Candidatus Phytoplasma prunorum TaxID=47565 RepID=UPI002FF2C1D0
MKNFLILDTSTEVQIVILVIDGNIVTFKKNFEKKKYVTNMVPLMDEVLKKNKTDFKDLDGILVGTGPGSYTGTRVAVLTSKIIALSFDIPLLEISSLILLTSGYFKKYLTPLIDARNNFFFGLSLKDKKIILPEGRYNKIFLDNYPNHILINNDNIKIDFKKIFFYAKKVNNIHTLVPNYLVKI